MTQQSNHAIVILGAQFGDEGKGKICDYLSPTTKMCIRYNGGANAGHTIKIKDTPYYTHLIPSGIMTPNVLCFMGNGVVINISALLREVLDLSSTYTKSTGADLGVADRLAISDKAHVTLSIHCLIDKLEGGGIGTTGQGIGQTYADKASRHGIRMCDIMRDNIKEHVLKLYARYIAMFDTMLGVTKFVTETGFKIKNYKLEDQIFTSIDEMIAYDIEVIDKFKKDFPSSVVNGLEYIKQHFPKSSIMIEGANATMLDNDFGTYPYVTSSSCTMGGVFTGTGISPARLFEKSVHIVGVVKAYITRVGGGVLPTELTDDIGTMMQTVGREFGVTTGRKRRCGWLDLVQLKYACDMNTFTSLNLTKLDVLAGLDEVKVCISYKDKITGKHIMEYPTDEEALSRAEPEYAILPGWKGFDISTCKDWLSLHPNVKAFVKFIDAFTDIKIRYINTGAERDQLITRE